MAVSNARVDCIEILKEGTADRTGSPLSEAKNMDISKDNTVIEKKLNAWSQLPDIEKVTDRLSVKDEQFLERIGRILVAYRQTSRFAVTLLHSHFEVSGEEVLVERLDEGRKFLVTEVRGLSAISADETIIPKSWRYTTAPGRDGKEFEVLTWSERSAVPQLPLRSDDELVIRDLAAVFKEHNAENTFGMSLVGTLPERENIWTEGTDFDGRRLVQEQLPCKEVDARNPIKTMWVFDEEGRFLITLGCCLRTRDGKGHTRAPHPAGWPKKPPRTE